MQCGLKQNISNKQVETDASVGGNKGNQLKEIGLTSRKVEHDPSLRAKENKITG